jgi:hypothetical protein
MKLNPFRASGTRRQTPRQLRAANEQLTAKVAEQEALLCETDEVITALIQERDWFHEHLASESKRAEEAEIVAACLGRQLETERKKVADLEAIAGPHVDSTDSPSPIYSEVTDEHPLPDFTGTPLATVEDAETTVQIPVVKRLSDAMAAAS